MSVSANLKGFPVSNIIGPDLIGSTGLEFLHQVGHRCIVQQDRRWSKTPSCAERLTDFDPSVAPRDLYLAVLWSQIDELLRLPIRDWRHNMRNANDLYKERLMVCAMRSRAGLAGVADGTPTK